MFILTELKENAEKHFLHINIKLNVNEDNFVSRTLRQPVLWPQLDLRTTQTQVKL